MKMQADMRSGLLFAEEETMPGLRQCLIHCDLLDFITWALRFLQVSKFTQKHSHSGSVALEARQYEAPRLIRQHFNQTKEYKLQCHHIPLR